MFFLFLSIAHQTIPSSISVAAQHHRHSLTDGRVLWNVHGQIRSDVKLGAVVILVENGD